MANDIDLITKFVPRLDAIYKAGAKSSILDAEEDRVLFKNAKTISLFQLSMEGLGDYSRNSGYVSGDVDGEWVDHTLSFDRGRKFAVDAMDDEETAYLAFGRLSGEFERTKVVPEVDAIRFSKLAGATGISVATPADIVVGTTDVAALIDAAELKMNEDEVPGEGRILFISETAYAALKGKTTRTILNGENGIQTDIETYDGMQIIRVPQSRFYTAITLLDGSTVGEEEGGYEGTASTGYKINFMIVQKDAVISVIKHVVPNVFSPSQNQNADAWQLNYRIYHDIFVEANKAAGIYLHRGSTALT